MDRNRRSHSRHSIFRKMESLVVVVVVVVVLLLLLLLPMLALVLLDTWPSIEQTSAEKIVKLSTM